jgi:hypothetical protein
MGWQRVTGAQPWALLVEPVPPDGRPRLGIHPGAGEGWPHASISSNDQGLRCGEGLAVASASRGPTVEVSSTCTAALLTTVPTQEPRCPW